MTTEEIEKVKSVGAKIIELLKNSNLDSITGAGILQSVQFHLFYGHYKSSEQINKTSID